MNIIEKIDDFERKLLYIYFRQQKYIMFKYICLTYDNTIDNNIDINRNQLQNIYRTILFEQIEMRRRHMNRRRKKYVISKSNFI